jgi:hypothetical protein
MSERITLVNTHRNGDIRWKLCRCSECGVEAICTPESDFYAEEGEPLLCERCMMGAAGCSDMPVVRILGMEKK